MVPLLTGRNQNEKRDGFYWLKKEENQLSDLFIFRLTQTLLGIPNSRTKNDRRKL